MPIQRLRVRISPSALSPDQEVSPGRVCPGRRICLAGLVLARETGHQVVNAEGEDYNLYSAATIAVCPEPFAEVFMLLRASSGVTHSPLVSLLGATACTASTG
jgi:hypothetical protein